MVLLVVVTLTACGVWYARWVRPRDAFLEAVTECMGGENTPEMYRLCAAEYRRAEGGK